MTVPAYLAHGVTLAFAWFLLVNVLVSSLVAFAGTKCANVQPTGAARFWFAMRLSPAVVSAIFVAALFLPSYWKYEPRDAVESFDVTLAALAFAAVVMLACACARGACAWWQASQRVRVWMRGARSLASDGSRASPIPAFEIDGPMPMMALAGIVRPRLFVARALVSTLTEMGVGGRALGRSHRRRREPDGALRARVGAGESGAADARRRHDARADQHARRRR
ncbi:MAG: hypothetical protein AUI11_00130 [Acidobacteria bacterium 13_2_20CM_2_66_4]|nr:MAG: hypothetical protein AUI11_00130 [Acidobacteria bacterium 13_2_20CM_2_66_4]